MKTSLRRPLYAAAKAPVAGDIMNPHKVIAGPSRKNYFRRDSGSVYFRSNACATPEWVICFL